MNQTNEQDIRITMLNSFLSCPHRDLDKLKDTHIELQKADPLFYAHLAAWYFKNGDIRDHKEVFVGALVCDEYHNNREVGLALFREIPVYLKRRVVGFVKGKKIKIRKKTGKKITRNKKSIDEVTTEEKNVGLYKNIPTSFKKDIENFLRYIETNNDLFDAIALKSANDLKGLYATLRISPSKRAQEILFEKVRPENSKLSVFEEIAKAENSTEIAKLIIKNKVPYTVAVGLVPQITPVILVALINSMSPQEVINNYASLEERGAMNNEDTKTLITAKLEKAKTAKNVSALKSKQAKKTGRVKNEESQKILDDIADTQIKRRGVIKVPTAIFVDKCVVGDTLLYSKKGLIKIEYLAPTIETVKKTNIDINISTKKGIDKATVLFINGKKEIKYITTKKGFKLGASLNHPLLCYKPESAHITWKNVTDINPGDFVILKRGTNCFGKDIIFNFNPKTPYQPDENIPYYPNKMNPDIAKWLGYFISEGRPNLYHTPRIEFSNNDQYLIQDFYNLTKNIFDLEPKLKDGVVSIESPGLMSFLINAIGIVQLRSRDCIVPDCILMSSEESQKKFLQAYFTGDGETLSCKSNIIAATSASKELLRIIQIMLLNFGIISKVSLTKSKATNGKNIDRNYTRLTIGGNDASYFMEKIGFSSPTKHEKMKGLIQKGHTKTWGSRWNFIPNLNNLINKDLKKTLRSLFPDINYFRNNSDNFPTDLLSQIFSNSDILCDLGDIETIQKSDMFIEEVQDTEIDLKEVYDICVPNDQTFIGNGFINHNSGSMGEAIEAGKKVSALISGVTEAPLYVVTFDTMAKEIKAEGTGMTAWEKAFEPIRDNGGTSIGVALDYLIRKNYYVEQILMITDEGENNHPLFADVFPKYIKKFNVTPTITIIYIPSRWVQQKVLSITLKQTNVAFDYYEPESTDYYALPGLITLLSRKSKLDLLYEVMDTPLPVRKPFDRKKKK